MGRGDAVLLFTDGLFEVGVPGGTQLGEEGLRRLAGTLAAVRGEPLLDDLIASVRSCSSAGAFQDDVCLLWAEVR